jgi:hypothetical protein
LNEWAEKSEFQASSRIRAMHIATIIIVWPIKQFHDMPAAFMPAKLSRERGEKRDSLSRVCSTSARLGD